MPIDFIRSKLAEEKKMKFGRLSVYATVIGIGLLILVSMLYFTAQQRETEANDAVKKLKADEKPVKDARTSIAHLEYGRTYFNERPDYLGCLKDLSQMYEYEERIWVTSISLKHDNQNFIQGVIQGKSTDYTLNLRLTDRFINNASFTLPQGLGQSRDAGGRGNEDSYTVTFKYKPVVKK